ncbi:glycosyltransferase family 4 protein [Sphingopyxis sp.]|uniref:glycosyltransferase family 4 protein n=1 Tax=Sphingopyxis sp. TaxID=1908224 RepID=UPI0025E608FB|nr:glycosyltransferase family 4 protein [Sphingopyxis sp.]
MAKTIRYVTRKWPPAMGGMETYSLKLTDALREMKPLAVMALPGRPDGRPPTMPKLLAFGFRTSIRLLIDAAPSSVVHLGDMALWPLGLFARLRSRQTQVVLSAHGTDVAYHRRGGLKGHAYGYYLRLGARLLIQAKVIANSEATRVVSMETGWRRIDVVPLATHLSGPPPDGGSEPFILFAGRLVERKGCAWFIRNVLPALPEHLRLKVAGTGWDESEWRALDNSRVDFLGNLDGEALVEAYRRACCVVVPNIEPRSGEYEGFGLVATEAAAAGGVVVASRTGGLVQAVEEGVTGMLVAAGDVPQWQGAIDRILSWTVEERRAFLSRSMEFCQAYYSWDRVARETLGVYEREFS